MIASPLRYPGGKGKLYKTVRKLIFDYKLCNKSYVEPFAGGYGIGIKLLLNGDIHHAIINDYDYHIYAIWYCIFYETESFVKLINDTPIDLQVWKKQKKIYNDYLEYSLLEVGFSAFFLNRTNYSGVLEGGPIGGFDQKSKYKINCRFNKKRLIDLIDKISNFKNSVEIYNMEVNDFIDNLILHRQDELFVNFDPPYVTKGEILYKNYFQQADHEQLAEKIKNTMNNVQWIMTYDDCELIRELYKVYNPQNYNLRYNAGVKRLGNELIITNLKL